MLERDIKRILEKKKDAVLLIFTDLDATLLDDKTYSFEPAKEALNLAEYRGIDIIFSTSKTKAEIDIYCKNTENKNPFIVENGGALFIPVDFFDKKNICEPLPSNDQYLIKTFGLPYKKILRELNHIKANSKIKIKGFSDMSEEEISKITGLSFQECKLAKAREYSEPFMTINKISSREINELLTLVQSRGLNIISGGRFYHLVGSSNKGTAVRYLVDIYKKQNEPEIITLALGDSKNDIPLLSSCDIKVAVQRPGGNYNPDLINATKPYLAKGIGPIGWNESVKKIIGMMN